MTATAQRTGSPFRGLASFGDSELDAMLFFGRERETEIVAANLLAERVTVLYGPSGVGKSSLLLAGVARRVREIALRRAVGRGPDLACVVFGGWAGDPLARLAAALEDEVRRLVSPRVPAVPHDARLWEAADHWSSLLDGDLCLVLDQFEELFVYHESPDEILRELAQLATRPSLRVSLLVAIRDDELARLGALERHLPATFTNARRLEPLDRDAGRAAILGPLERWSGREPDRAPFTAEPELVESVLDQCATVDGTHVEAPYLQLVMERVFDLESERGSTVLRAATLDELGGAEAIVRRHLDVALDALEPAEQEAASRMFEHLVTPSGTKIAHRASDLATFARADEGTARTLLETLGHERILRPLDYGDDGQRRYEIFHDVLSEPIVEWNARRELAAERSRAHARQRRLVAVAAGAVLVALLMVGVAVYALAQRGSARTEARRAHGSALAAAALAQLPDDDPGLALRLARAAVDENRSPSVEAVLRTALLDSRGRAILPGGSSDVLAAGFTHGLPATVDRAGVLRTFTGGRATARRVGRVRAAAFATDGHAVALLHRFLVEVQPLAAGARGFAFRERSPTRAVAIDARGDRVAVTTADGGVDVRTAGGRAFRVVASRPQTTVALDRAGTTVAAAGGEDVTVWRVGRRRPLAHVHVDGGVASVALARDGSRLVTAGTQGAAMLRALPSGALVGSAIARTQLTFVAFSPDGSAFVVGSRDGVARIYNTTVARLLNVLARHDAAVTAAAFSPDARSLVTGAADGSTRTWDPGVAPDLHLVARPRGCCTAFTPDGDGVAVGAGRRVLVVRAGRVVAERSTPARVTALAQGPLAAGAPVTALAASPSFVARAEGRDVVVTTRTGKLVAAFTEAAAVAGLAISPDGTRVATAGRDGVARVRDLHTGRLRRTLTGHTAPLTAVAFSPDGSHLATSSKDKDARIWDLATGGSTVLRYHFGVVSDVTYSRDGRWLLTAGPTTVGLWYAATGRLFAAFGGHADRVIGAALTGDTITTASVDGTIRSYRCSICGDLDSLVAVADARLAHTGGALTPAERRRALG